ncbi:MAG: T9SS type A sorting domain-containing protein [Bacteroidota bacterium]
MNMLLNVRNAHRTLHAFTFVLIALVLGAFSQPLNAQWTTSCSILQSNPQAGDTVSLVVNVGDPMDPVDNEGGLNFRVAYPTGLLSIGEFEIDIDQSFFVCGGCGYTATVTADEGAGELVVDIELTGGINGSGHGELLRVHGGVLMEDNLKMYPTALEEASSRLTVYPNPVAEALNITWSEDSSAQIRIFDLQGRTFATNTLQPGETNYTLATGTLPPGQYWLRLQTKDKVLSKSFRKL